MSKREPLPWFLRTGPDSVDIMSATCGMVASQVNLANAEFIVRCVNSHDDLVVACKVLTKAIAKLAAQYGLRRDTIFNFPDASPPLKCLLDDILACGSTAIAKAKATD